jgi:hypothetical protein
MFMNRIIGVFRLDAATFEDVEHDQNATGQAAIVVGIAALLSAIGSGLGAAFTNTSFFGNFISALLWTFIGWLVWSVVSFLVGTALFGGKADLGEMLRVIGFAYAPQVLSIIPCIGGIVGAIWSLVAGFIAIRQGLDLDNLKALLTVIVGFIVYVIGYLILALILGGIGAIFGG